MFRPMLAVFLVLLAACGGSSTADGTGAGGAGGEAGACTPREQRDCDCGIGAPPGSQACAPDGSEWYGCACKDPGPRPDAGADADDGDATIADVSVDQGDEGLDAPDEVASDAPVEAAPDVPSPAATCEVAGATYADCDHNPSTGDPGGACVGYERRIDMGDVRNCGGCGIQCPATAPDDASGWLCAHSMCTPVACTGSRRNCDGDTANGCEALITVDELNCGACGVAVPDRSPYPGPGASPTTYRTCIGGKMVTLACPDGRLECNGLVADECEAHGDHASDCP